MHLTSSPVDWYAARAAGIVAYLLLSAVVVLGLTLSGRRRLHRPAREDRLVVAHELLERWHRLGDRCRRRPVQDDAHGALVVVLDDEDDGAREARVEQRRRGDQEPAAERFPRIHAR